MLIFNIMDNFHKTVKGIHLEDIIALSCNFDHWRLRQSFI
jgi:hypothetical protein